MLRQATKAPIQKYLQRTQLLRRSTPRIYTIVQCKRSICSFNARPRVANKLLADIKTNALNEVAISTCALKSSYGLPNFKRTYVQMRMDPNQQPEKPALEQFGTNLTKLARER